MSTTWSAAVALALLASCGTVSAPTDPSGPVILTPTPEVTHALPRPSPTHASRGHHRTRAIEVTAYCPTGHRTKSGAWPREGMAAGPKGGWPMGTRLDVPGWRVVTITDRIGHSSDLDLFMDSCRAARKWGRRSLRVTELSPSGEKAVDRNVR